MNDTQQAQEEKQITRKQKELADKAHILKERVSFLRNRLCAVLTKRPPEALRGTPTQFSMNQICKTIGGTALLYEQLAATAETLDCAISEIEEIIDNLEI